MAMFGRGSEGEGGSEEVNVVRGRGAEVREWKKKVGVVERDGELRLEK